MDMANFKAQMVLVSFFLNVNIAMGWILRLPCKTEANFSVSAVGHALEHNVLLKLTLPLEECQVNCLFTHHCKSFNHKQSGDDNCELNSETDVTKPGALVARSGWTYFATNQFTRLIGSFCQKKNPCRAAEFCIDDCACPGYRCVRCSAFFEVSYGWFISNSYQQSCKSLHSSGSTANGTYDLDGIGPHYCMMNGFCGPGGWTLAMKLDGQTGTFAANSLLWTNEDLHNQASTNLNDGNAKFNAFSNVAFEKICIGMKAKGATVDTTRWLMIPKASCSLLDVFASGESSFTNISVQKWRDLVPENGNPLQINCHRQGFNIKQDGIQSIFARIGIMGNNENECRTPDSNIGVGLTGRIDQAYSGTRYVKKEAYIFIQ